MELGEGLEPKSNEEQLRELGGIHLEEKEAQWGPYTLYNCLQRDCSQVRVSLFSRVRNTGPAKMDFSHGMFVLDIRKSFFLERMDCPGRCWGHYSEVFRKFKFKSVALSAMV